MLNEEKRIWGIHTQDDNLFLKNDVIAIGWSDMGDLGNIDANRDAFKEKEHCNWGRNAVSLLSRNSGW